MNDSIILPEDCMTMAEVRAGVDAVDAEIGRLLGLRFGYMRAAARIKPTRDAVRDEGRKTQVIDNARDHAVTHGAPADAVARVYDHLVEELITYELGIWDQTRG